jgi:hypothetical protein
LASVDAITGVLDMLNERLAAIGEDRYRGLVGTAQRQAHHVEGALRAMARGLPGEVGPALSEREPAPASFVRAASEAAEADASGERESDRAKARRRMQSAVDAVGAAQEQLADIVALARKAGVSWDETAAILGMTRQGASKRYGHGRNV